MLAEQADLLRAEAARRADAVARREALAAALGRLARGVLAPPSPGPPLAAGQAIAAATELLERDDRRLADLPTMAS